MDTIKADEILDCYGLLCPMPIIQTAQIIKEMKKSKLLILVNLKEGKAIATAYGCDLTYKYIKINAAYHS